MKSFRTFKKLIKFRLYFFIFSLPLTYLLSVSSASAVQIPSELAQVQEEIQGTNGKTVILIQEAHVDYGAQKAIADLLKTLAEKDSLRLVLVEGGWDNMSLAYLRNYGSPEGRREVAERYLKEGKISGEEYLDIVTDLDFELWGIEDPKLYEENMKAFLKITEAQEKWLSALAELQKATDTLAEKIFPPALLALEKKKEAFGEEKISLLDYVKYLTQMSSPHALLSFPRPPKIVDGSAIFVAEKRESRDAGSPIKDFGDDTVFRGNDPSLLDNFPHLKKLVSVSGIQADFDIEKVELEKQNLIQALARKITKPELEKLQILGQRKNPEEELVFLKSLVDYYRQHAASFRKLSIANLAFYTASLEGAMKMDSRKLFPEIERLEEVLSTELAVTEDPKRLLAISRAVRLLKKLFELKLGSEDFEKIQHQLGTVSSPKALIGDLASLDSRFSATKMADPSTIFGGRGNVNTIDFALLDEAIPEAMSFYRSARKREKALVANAVKKAKAEGDPVAALIAGGFHTEKLAEAFKKLGYTVMVVAPRFTPTDTIFQHQKYFEIMKYKWGNGPTKVSSSEFGVSSSEARG